MTDHAEGKILVVEDDPETLANLRDILGSAGFQLKTVTTGRQAMEQGCFGEFLAILLDRRLADGSADVFLPRIKQMAPDAEVIVITEHADRDGKSTALRHGAADCLSKPIDGDVLRTSLAHVAKIKRAERRAEQAERLAGIGQMVAILAHEGRNSLQQMAAYHALLALEDQERSTMLTFLARAEAARKDLTRLFDDLCCEAGTLALRLEPLDLGDAWRKVWADLIALQTGRAVELAEETRGVSLFCDGDQFRLEQVFRNLLENALAACPDPVRVEIRCSDVTHRGRPALRLVVADNGPGLTREQRQKAFEPFYTTKSHGTGLGVPICRKIIQAHGGELSIGDGSVGAEFIIVLPRDQE